MRSLRLALLLSTAALSVLSAVLDRSDSDTEAMDYLEKYGYLQKPLDSPSHSFQPEEIEEALRVFQAAMQLPVTGEIDEATQAMMSQPRCGMEDPFNQRTLKYRLLGDKVWRYTDFQLDSGYPKQLTRIPANIDAALYWQVNDKIFFFKIPSQFGMPNRFSPHHNNSSHCSDDPKIQWASTDHATKPASFFTQELESGYQRATDLWRTNASPAAVCSELTERLASRVRCRAMRRNSPCRFYFPNSRERQSQCDAPFGVPSKDRPTPHSQDANLRSMTHPVHHTAALLPVSHSGTPQ
ncbi:UNVERIFIED_CONTAM: hypothetical protein FKN15_038761 [Acipenser sinensis]